MQVALRRAVVSEHQQPRRAAQVLLGRRSVVDHVIAGVLDDRGSGPRWEALAQVAKRDRLVENRAAYLGDGRK